MMCLMPYGIQDFKEVRFNKYMYIDKTRYIELMEKTGRKAIHFLRPRRFGKTLFTSTLSAYYDIAAEDEFDNLFRGTYIYNHKTIEKNSYYILRFDFSGLNTENIDLLKQSFHNHVYSRCKKFMKQYHLHIEVNEGIDAANCLSQFLDSVSTLLDHSIYVMVDEYDHFANELLSFNFHGFHRAVSENGYVRKFYEVLKTGSVDSTVGKIFITGVSPITMDSMTSGFNISTNYSLDPRFNEMMGFTIEEMKHLISSVHGIDNQEKTLSVLKQIYDGYMFSKNGKHHVFNPNMALYYLDYVQSFGVPPEEIIDPNIYSDYKKIENLLNIKPDPEQRKALEEILSGHDILVNLTTSYELTKQFSKSDFVSLLYYLGYLTISGSKGMRVKLSVPNEVIRNVYFDYFNQMLRQELNINTEDYADAIDNILYDKNNTLFINQMEEILQSLDNRDYIGFQEKETKIAAMAIAKANASVLVKSEYAVPNGFIDLVFFPYKTDGATALIELKYIKAKDFNESILQEKRHEAYEQLKKYGQAKEFQNIACVKWILIFCKNKCVWNEQIE